MKTRLLSAGTAGMGRVHPRRVAGRAGRQVRRTQIDGFFSKSYSTRFIFVLVAGTRVPRVQVRGYSGTGTGRRVRIRDFLLFLFAVFVLQIYFLFYNVVKSE
jgi:hypothetical protein